MHVLIWIAMGAIAGLLAQFMPADKRRGGLSGNLVVGAMGAVVAGMLLSIHGTGATGITIWSLGFAFMGAAALLWASRALTAQECLN